MTQSARVRETGVATRDGDAVGKTDAARESAQATTALRPPCDIRESADDIVMLVDMPGVSRDRLVIQAAGDTLAIEGTVGIDMPAGIEAMHADVRSRSYRRSFVLSPDLDRDKITASLKDGVLTLHIPKREEVRPRKIEIRTG